MHTTIFEWSIYNEWDQSRLNDPVRMGDSSVVFDTLKEAEDFRDKLLDIPTDRKDWTEAQIELVDDMLGINKCCSIAFLKIMAGDINNE